MANPILPAMTGKRIVRFWDKVEKRGPEECWPWQGSKSRIGYGATFTWDGEKRFCFPAHRVAWALANQTEPGQVVMHSCDNRLCCNPAHLTSGTQLANIRDMMSKDRSNFWGRQKSRTGRMQEGFVTH